MRAATVSGGDNPRAAAVAVFVVAALLLVGAGAAAVGPLDPAFAAAFVALGILLGGLGVSLWLRAGGDPTRRR